MFFLLFVLFCRGLIYLTAYKNGSSSNEKEWVVLCWYTWKDHFLRRGI